MIISFEISLLLLFALINLTLSAVHGVCPAWLVDYATRFGNSTSNLPRFAHDQQEFIIAHNKARAAVGVGQMTWDDTVRTYAQNYANKRVTDCQLLHSGGPYGENLAESTSDLSATDAVQLWVGEKVNYDYNTNSCASGGVCGHYTQVVWNTSVRLGCARVRCNNGGTFISCNYDPPGNYVGQRPYTTRFGNSTRNETELSQDQPKDYVDAHNKARAAVGVGEIAWNNTVAAYAQSYATQRAGDCNLVHSGGPYGENLAWSSAELSGTDAVKMWVDEKAYYDYNSNSCASGQMCGHYTQVVWRNSVRVGCAKVRCSNGGTFITCNYDPPGNYVGQKPY